MLKRIIKYIIGAVVLVIAALFVGAIPLPTGEAKAVQSAGSKRIYVISNGFHSDIAIPFEGLGTLGVKGSDFPVDLNQVKFWAVGWGSITAYTSLLAVSDLTIGIAAKALAFDDAVMHITPLGALEAAEKVFAFDLTEKQYSTLLNEMKSWFLATSPMEVTQGFGDRFYDAKGQFSPWHTCNSWTGRQLRNIGINVGYWTPISQSLEFGLARASD